MSQDIFRMAHGITNRPDLVTEHEIGFRRAISHYHSLEDWGNDKATATVSASFTSGNANIDLSSLTPKLCRFGDGLGCVTLNGEQICSTSGCGSTSGLGYTLMGTTLNIKTNSVALCNSSGMGVSAAVVLNYYTCPTTTGCDTDSWIAAAYPEIISQYMGEYVSSVIEKRPATYRREDQQLLVRNHLYP